MKAVLRGGPLDKREIPDVTEATEYINIPANSFRDPRYACYQRVGDLKDMGGHQLLFDFVAVFPGSAM